MRTAAALVFPARSAGAGLVAPTLRPNADGSLKSNPAGKLAGPLSPFPTCRDFVHAFSWNTSDSIAGPSTIPRSARGRTAALGCLLTALCCPTPPESVTFLDPGDPVRHRAYPTGPQLREKNLPLVIDNPAVPHPALDHDPQPGLACPLAGPPATARRLDRALQHHARAHRDLRRDPALHRRLVQGIRLDSRRHQRTAPIRPTHQTGSTEEGQSGSDPCGRTGNALSIGEIMVLRHPLRLFITP